MSIFAQQMQLSTQGLQWQPALGLLDKMESAKVAPNVNSNMAESLGSAFFLGGLAVRESQVVNL